MTSRQTVDKRYIRAYREWCADLEGDEKAYLARMKTDIETDKYWGVFMKTKILEEKLHNIYNIAATNESFLED